MYQTILNDASFYRQLLRFDEDMAAEARQRGCGCGGKLHSARYPRKPRGVPAELEEEYTRRWSFCCAEEGCRKRTTPVSFRFLSRRVYVAAVVVLVSVMRHGVSAARMARLSGIAGEISRRTLERWRRWWQEEFPCSAFWKAMSGRFALAVEISRLPLSLLELFQKRRPEEQTVDLLRFILPLTAPTVVLQKT